MRRIRFNASDFSWLSSGMADFKIVPKSEGYEPTEYIEGWNKDAKDVKDIERTMTLVIHRVMKSHLGLDRNYDIILIAKAKNQDDH